MEKNQELINLAINLAKSLSEAIELMPMIQSPTEADKVDPDAIMCEFSLHAGLNPTADLSNTGNFLKGRDINDAFNQLKSKFRPCDTIDMSETKPYMLAVATNGEMPYILYELRK